MSTNEQDFISFLIGILLSTMFWGWFCVENLTINTKIRSGKQFIIDASSYKCLETNTLKKDD